MGAGNGGVGTILRVQRGCLPSPGSLLGTGLARLTAGPSPAGKTTRASFPSAKSIPAEHIVLHPVPNPSLLSLQPLSHFPLPKSLSELSPLASAIFTTSLSTCLSACSHSCLLRPYLTGTGAPTWVLFSHHARTSWLSVSWMLSHQKPSCQRPKTDTAALRGGGQPVLSLVELCWGRVKSRGKRGWSQRTLGLL